MQLSEVGLRVGVRRKLRKRLRPLVREMSPLRTGSSVAVSGPSSSLSPRSSFERRQLKEVRCPFKGLSEDL